MNRLTAWLAISILLLITPASIGGQAAQAQSFTVLHTFTGAADGGFPDTGVTIDGAGNLYGTTLDVGDGGTVFKLTRSGSGWTWSLLHLFNGYPLDGEKPKGRVIFGPDRSLYGTTSNGGKGDNGTVFKLAPPTIPCPTVSCPWRETVLYNFILFPDGTNPSGDLIFDQAGSIFGTTDTGGSEGCGYNCGVVYQLTPSGGRWTQSVLYRFQGRSDGQEPYGGVIFDNAGNLYGTTVSGGDADGDGLIFRLTPSGSGWIKQTLHQLQYQLDGGGPYAGVIFDQAGNLYGATSYGGISGGGTVFQLTPSGGRWTFTVLYSFIASGTFAGPSASLVMDQAGNLYGATVGNIEEGDFGTVFKLTPFAGGWTETVLHHFTGGNDGGTPLGSLVLDSQGKLYGTTSSGGAYGAGVVFEITP